MRLFRSPRTETRTAAATTTVSVPRTVTATTPERPRIPGLDEQSMLSLSGVAGVKRLNAGEAIFGEGEAVDSLIGSSRS